MIYLLRILYLYTYLMYSYNKNTNIPHINNYYISIYETNKLLHAINFNI